ncbi:hypothetical protein D3C81_1001960 [compost metagenome]
MRPGRKLLGRLDQKRVIDIEIVDHRRRARRHGRFAARHELHQRQALAFAVGRIDDVTGRLHQPFVIRVRQIAIDQHDTAAIRLVFVEVMKDIGERLFGIVVSEFEHQRCVIVLAKSRTEGTDHVLPVLAAVARIEHRGVDHAFEQQRLLGDRCEEVDTRATAQMNRTKGIQIDLTAVDHQPFDRQTYRIDHRLPLQLNATRGESIPDRGGYGNNRVTDAHRFAHRIDRVTGMGDRGTAGLECSAPVVQRIAGKWLVGDGAEFPGKDRQRRAGQMHRRAVRWREREKYTRLVTGLAVGVQRIDFSVRVHDLDHPPESLQDRPILLENEVIAVLRTPEVTADGVLVGFRMNDDQHEALSVIGATLSTGDASPKKSATRFCNAGCAQ